jgi:hypothetical protein
MHAAQRKPALEFNHEKYTDGPLIRDHFFVMMLDAVFPKQADKPYF